MNKPSLLLYVANLYQKFKGIYKPDFLHFSYFLDLCAIALLFFFNRPNYLFHMENRTLVNAIWLK